MCKLPERLKKLREEKNITQSELAEELGFKNYTTITKWESGINLPRGKELKLLSELFGVSSDYILGLSDVRRLDTHTDISFIYSQLEPPRQSKVYDYAENQLEEQNSIRIYGQVAANPEAMDYVDESYEEYITDNVPRGAEGALVVTGDSMEDDYKNGSIVFYKRQPDVENGQLAVIEIDGIGTTFKKVYRDYDNQQIILRSINSKYPDRTLEPERVKIVGIVLN